MNNDKQAELNAIGASAYRALVDMVAALQCDYDQLEALREARDDHDGTPQDWASTNPSEAQELAELEAAAGDCVSQDDARQRIEEDALSIEVRSDWQSIGETLEPAEYCMLLTTGGPAVRIIGELDNGEPSRPRLQVQDWGTPWTDYNDAERDVLQAYCACFYFGEG